MFLLVLGMLINYFLVVWSSTYCNSICDVRCCKCDSSSGYNWIYYKCIKNCPSGYSFQNTPLSSDNWGSTECVENLTGPREIFDLQFDSVLDQSSSTIGSFYTPNNQAFGHYTKVSPVPASERGFYFHEQSSLKTNEVYIPSFQHILTFWARPLDQGKLFTLKSSSGTEYEVSYLANKWRFSNYYLDTFVNSGSTYRVDFSCEISSNTDWHKIEIYIEFEWRPFSSGDNDQQDHCYFKGYRDGSQRYSYHIENCWYRYDQNPSDLKWRIGATDTDQSFEGFLYRLNFRNSNLRVTDSHPGLSNCEFNTLVNSGSCQSTTTCNLPDCVACDTQCSDCRVFPWVCRSCQNVIVEEICMYVCPYQFSCPSASPGVVLQEDFSKFPKDFSYFNSGSDPSTYHPFTSPDTDDVLPLKSRGIYFDTTKYVVTKDEVELYHTFTVSMWVRLFSSGSIVSKGSFLDISDSAMTLTLEDFFESGTTHSVGVSVPTGVWKHLAFSCEFYYKYRTILRSYVDNTEDSNYSIENRLFRHLGGHFFKIGGSGSSSQGYIYSIRLWQEAISDFTHEYQNEYCGSGQYGNCFWNTEVQEYQDSNGDPQPCDSCPNGCIDSTHCNPCDDPLCDDCQSFQNNACLSCIPNSSGDPCECTSGHYLASDSCEPCVGPCSECTGPEYFECTACVGGKNLIYGKICLSQCPDGFSVASQTCNNDNELVLGLEFYDHIKGDLGNLNYGVSDDFYPSLDNNDPWPAKDRGYYFHSSAYSETNLFIAPHFTILGWIRLVSDGGQFLYKGIEGSDDRITASFLSGSLKVEVNAQSELISLTGTSDLKNNWKHYCIVGEVMSDGTTKVSLKVDNSDEGHSQSVGLKYLEDDSSTFKIGADSGNSFIGFLWSLKVYNVASKAGEDYPMTACPSDPSCASNCPIDKYPDALCSECDVSCVNGCVRSTDCNLCFDELCYICNTFGDTCTGCVTNAEVDPDTGDCECKEGFYQVYDKCLPCTINCKECSSGEFDECLVCSSGYMIHGVCQSFCPTGFTQGTGVCDLVDGFGFHLRPTKIQNKVPDLQNSIPVLTGINNDFYPNYHSTDPLAAKDRGYYFTGTSFMQLPPNSEDPSPLLRIAPEFTATIWVRPQTSSGVLLSKQQDTTFGTLLRFELDTGVPKTVIELTSGTKSSVGTPFNLGAWNFFGFRFAIESHQFQIKTLANQVETQDPNLGNTWYLDEPTNFVFSVGASYSGSGVLENFFKGFIWEVRLYNYALDPTTLYLDSGCIEGCSICPIENSNHCLPECGIDSFWNRNNCAGCPSNCLYGCSREGTCNLCANPLCDVCEGFELGECTDCKENAGGSPCTCNSGYGLLQDQCVACGDDSSEVVNSECFCKDSYYNSEPEGLNCQECQTECQQCSPRSIFCVECLLNNSFLSPDGNCVCPENSYIDKGSCLCHEGFYLQDNSCLECDSSCKTCNGGSRNDCTSCYEEYLYPDGSCGPCPDGNYLEGTECLDCPQFCLTCESKDYCKSCVENAALDSFRCKCEPGYFQNSTICSIDYFYADLFVHQNNTLEVNFTNPLEKDLEESQFTIQLKNKDISYQHQLQKTKDHLYSIIMEFKDYVEPGEVVYLNFTQPVVGSGKQVLFNTTLQGELFEFITKKDERFQVVAETITYIALAIGISISILTSNPSSLWLIINTVQILSFIPVTNAPLTSRLDVFFKGLNNIEIMPNPFDFFEHSEEGNNTHAPSKDYGYETNLFLKNSGQSLTLLFIVLVALPLVWGFSKCKSERIRKVFLGILREYRYGVMVRFWIEAYLELTVSAFIQVYKWSGLKYFNYVNFMAGCLFLAAIVLSPFLVMLFVKKRKEEIQKISKQSVFYQVWGSFFYEFKLEDNPSAKYFYSLFLAKRLLFAANLILGTNFPYAQYCVNLVLMVSFLLFLCIVKPYLESILQYASIISELGISLVFFLQIYFLSEDRNLDKQVENAVIYVTLFIVLVQVLASVLMFSKVILKFLKTKKNKGAKNPEATLETKHKPQKIEL